MRLLLLLLLVITVGLSQEGETNRQAYKNSIEIKHLRDDQETIMKFLEKLESQNSEKIRKYELILEGNGHIGLKEQVRINSVFRQEMTKFIWMIIAFFVAQLGSVLYIGVRTISISKKIKESI